jgi:hypothetical protein
VHPFVILQSWARTQAVLEIDFYELLGNPTTSLIVPPGPYNVFVFDMSKTDDDKKNYCFSRSFYKQYINLLPVALHESERSYTLYMW